MATRLAERLSPGALVLALAIPVLFLHVRYQPGVSVGFGPTAIDAYLSDFAVLAVVVAAAAAGARHGFAPLRTGRALWLAAVLFLLWVFVGVAIGHAHSAAYAWRTHAVTAAKFAEYALLAPAVPLLLRTRRDVLLPAWSLVGWSTVATTVGVLQFFGADIFISGAVGRRQASFLSSADFAALSTAALLVGIVAIATRARAPRALVAAALVTGVVGMIIAGAMASVLGLGTALVVLAFARGRRDPVRFAAAGAVAVLVLLGAIGIRGNDLDAFARFIGAAPSAQQSAHTKVETYAHRTLLSWLGIEIWKDDPIVGVGWQGSAEPANFEPYLPAAHRRFPDVAPLAFPSAAPDRRYGVQDSWIQALADLGVVGLLLWAGVFAAAVRCALRVRVPHSLYALLGIAVLVWLWTAQGFVAGIPLDALTWLVFGLAATRLER